MCLWGNLYDWSVYDLQTRKFYYSTPQRAKRSRSWISEYGVQRCRDRASPPGHLRRSIKQRISLKIWMWGYIYARAFWERHRTAFFDARVCHPNAVSYKSFSLSRKKKCIRNRSLEVSKKMKCYKRLIYKQFVQESGLCDPQFLSYFPKRFTHLRRALYGDAILVYRFGAPTWPAEINKNMWSSFFL